MARGDIHSTLSAAEARRAARAIESTERTRKAIAKRFGFNETTQLYAAIHRHLPDWQAPGRRPANTTPAPSPSEQSGRIAHGGVGRAAFGPWERETSR